MLGGNKKVTHTKQSLSMRDLFLPPGIKELNVNVFP